MDQLNGANRHFSPMPTSDNPWSWDNLHEHERRHFNALARDPGEREATMFISLMDLEPQYIQRFDMCDVPGHCHANALAIAAKDPDFEVAHGWVDLGEYMLLHSVVRWTKSPTSHSLFCVSPANVDWLVFRPDPRLRVGPDTAFTRNGKKVPNVVRRDPEQTAQLARQTIAKMKAGTCTAVSEHLVGDPKGSEPDKVRAWLAQIECEAGVPSLYPPGQE